ncbi:MAG: DUF177 domain-containing protein, partial [Hyphomicrobiales bacterium]
LTATTDEKRAIARHLGLESVDNLEVLVNIRPWRRHGLGVDGTLVATIGQICTLTAEPMTTEISETFDDRFYPEDRDEKKRQAEAIIDVEATSDYETFAGDTVDLGVLAVEYLTLAVDPYPKRSGAVLQVDPSNDDVSGEPETRTDSPFARLAGHFSPDAGNPVDNDNVATAKKRRKPNDME